MKFYPTLFSLFIFLFFSLKFNAQTLNGDKVIIGVRDSIQSKILAEQRDFFVYVPERELDSNEKYSVLYTLDAKHFFVSAVGMVHNLSEAWGGSTLPKMIVVGIPHPNRFHDLTPADPNIKSSGGNSKFLNYLEEELIPYIDKKYPTNSYRTYVGHSLGGLAVIQALLEKPHLFSNYIALDPSLWWSDQVLLKRAKLELDTINLSGKSLFIGMANTLPEGMDIDSLKRITFDRRNGGHAKSIWDFSNKILPQAKTDLEFLWKYYKDDGHVSSQYISQLDALRWLFAWNDTKQVNKAIFDKNNSPKIAIKAYTEYYQMVSHKLGYNSFPSSDYVVSLARHLVLRIKSPEKALAFLKFNIDNYPEDHKVYEGLGWFYEQQEDNKKAIEAYRKSIEKGGDKTVLEKIEKLDKGK